MRDGSLWRGLLGVEKTVIERVGFEEDAELLVAHVRSTSRARGRCGICGRPCPGYDAGGGRRRWRALDLGTMRAVLEADASRVTCAEYQGSGLGARRARSRNRLTCMFVVTSTRPFARDAPKLM